MHILPHALDCHQVCVNACSMVQPSFPGAGPSSCGLVLLISLRASARCLGLCDLFCRYVFVRLAKASILFRFFLTTFLYIETHIYFQAQYWSPSSYNPKASSGGQAEASSLPFEEKDDKDVQARVTRNKWCCFLCCPSIYASLQFVQT